MYMLKRAPTTSDGRVVDRLQESTRVYKPFKAPTVLVPATRNQPTRKRKRAVSYKEGQENDNCDSDEDAKKKRKKTDKDGMFNEEELKAAIKTYPVYKPKPFEMTVRRFSMPSMMNKSGEIVPLVPTNVSLGIRPQAKVIPRPLHDPMEDHAIVLYDPTIDDRETDEEKKEREKEEAKERAAKEAEEKTAGLYNPHKNLRKLLGEDKDKKDKIPKVPVVIDPRLTKVLRPHQVEGVKFLYKCTTGMIVDNQYGCIMADEMGLGKTLQCIALLWTLIKQSPHAGKPTIEKCIIACPSSLVKNWANELGLNTFLIGSSRLSCTIVKWLGKDAISALAVDGKVGKAELLAKVGRWVEARGRNVTQPVMIVSYETLRTLSVHLANCSIGLLLCDEGHRLKNSDSLTFQSLNALDVKRRVILTGTPIQNDLSEYFSLLNFANPSFLGTREDFRKNFENAIIRGRDASSTAEVQAESERKLKELGSLVTKFIIRRTNDLLSKYLPVKYEHVVFCGLSEFQLALYRLFISSPEIKALLRGADSQPLKAINILKKLCNHPELLNLPDDLSGSEKLIPEGFRGAGASARDKGRNQNVRCIWGGKFVVLERFLHQIRTTTNDKIVLISNYTQTLDLFEKLCRSKKYGFFRLDGTMTITKRQKLVDQFNDPNGKEFVFLLSSKAGGCGINLIGANRLILFDPDWNPAADQQALARVWRDGQKKECFVYRFISTGTIEEKIFQRQASKQALSSAVVDEKEDAERHFSLESLRQLFTFNENTICDTHDTFKCKRCKNGKQVIKSSALLYGDASTWNHFTNAELKGNHDDLLRAEVGLPEVSFVFQYISH
ncbi:DNA repair protein, SNF2 family [Phlebopus sp. FC_14]|nr:DNA repair protein, SNF2 family [Phlebopus sp. FC_14]